VKDPGWRIVGISTWVVAIACGAVAAAGPEASRQAEVERFLREGTVVSMKEIGSGITKPLRVELELYGRTMRAAFKTVAIHNPGVSQFPDGSKEIDFRDDYRYEYAAYLLDRRLGMNMVPVTVLREIDGSPGALVEWVEDGISEAKRMARDNAMPEPLRRQQSVMLIFDTLIGNVDRHGSNQLITADQKLHLIDHSRSFRKQRSLPAQFSRIPAGIFADVLEQLESLQQDELGELLGDVLSGVQIKALLKRRDKIVEKIRTDIREYGENVVLWKR